MTVAKHIPVSWMVLQSGQRLPGERGEESTRRIAALALCFPRGRRQDDFLPKVIRSRNWESRLLICEALQVVSSFFFVSRLYNDVRFNSGFA